VEEYAGRPPHGVDVAGLVAWSRALIAHGEHDSLAELTPDDLTPRLRT
jgi:hypothetical protein